MPGIFGDESIRLLRDDWASVKMLAEEMFAILASDIQFPGPLQITMPSGSSEPAIKITSRQGDVAIQMTKTPGDGTATVTEVGSDGVESGTGDAAGSITLSPVGGGGGGGGGIPCKVVSGSGSTYSVDLYENGTGVASTRTVTATQLQIASGASIPANTWAFASEVAGTFYICVAVWQ